MGVKLTKGLSVQVDVPFGGRSVRVKMFGGRSVGGRSVKAPFSAKRQPALIKRTVYFNGGSRSTLKT
jgi:hypothetical protein